MLTAYIAAILLVSSLSALATPPAPEISMRRIINFDGSPLEPRWVAVNDGVMGGRSSGAPTIADGNLAFRGELSLANNGGFASVRSVGRDFDLGKAKAVVLRVRGDGRRYQLRLATDVSYRGVSVSFGSGFSTTPGKWTEVRVPLDTLVATIRGTQLQGPKFDPARVREIGLLIGDKREGPFALSVDWIAVE